MSHLPGHIDRKSASTGLLTPCLVTDKNQLERPNPDFKLIFIPPTWTPEPGDEVGFHLLTVHCEDGDKLVAYDLVRWVDHRAAEAAGQAAFNTQESLEEYFWKRRNNGSTRNEAKQAIEEHLSKQNQKSQQATYWDVIDRTIAYVSSSDFNRLYLKEANTLRETNDVVSRLLKNQEGILRPSAGIEV
jgi:hypothetical protein